MTSNDIRGVIFTILASTTFCLEVLAAQFSATIENDALMKAGDNDYTHGTGFEFVDDSFMHYKLGQNMYAPSDLRREDHIVGDRPYAGIIYGGVGYEFFRDHNLYWTHYGELDFGMIGPAAFCGHTQKFIHKILNCRDPKGWHNQLHNEFVVNGQWWEKYNWYLCDYVALVPRVGVLAGTIQDAAEIGCDLKIGWNLRNDVGNSIMFSAPRNGKAKSFLDKLSIYGFVGVDERYYLYNHFLEGSFIRSKDRDQGLDVDIEPFVGELQCGAGLQYESFIIKYYMIFRQDEFKGQKHSPNYGGLMVGWSW